MSFYFHLSHVVSNGLFGNLYPLYMKFFLLQVIKRVPPPSRKDKIKKLILDIYLNSKQIYGAPKITKELEKMGIKIAEKTVGNYMREMKIKAHYVKPFTKTTIDPDFDNSLKNLLNEQFNPEKPNAIWCSDITYIHTKTGFAYLTSIMDLFSRRIIAWRLSETLEAKWVVECVHEAKKSRHTTRPLILHY
jgi:putative transposase